MRPSDAHWKLSRAWLISSMNTSSSDGSELVPGQARPFAIGRDRGLQRFSSRPETCRLVPNGATMSMPGLAVKLVQQTVQILAADIVGDERGLLDHLVDRAVRQQFAIGDIGDLVAALGLVHVMGGDQHGEPLGRERMDLVPELAPRLGIDAGGRLVEQKKLRIRQRAGAERQPLLPAARKRAGELLLAALETEPLDHGARRADRHRPCRRAARRIRDSRAPTGPDTG